MVTTSILKVHDSDKKKLMKECKERFLKAHPEMRGYPLSQAFMFKKLVDFYIESP